MPDLYAQITTLDPSVLDVLIKASETRAVDPRQRAIRQTFLSWIDLPDGARLLEVGCGSGAICRELARLPKVREVVGLDPSGYILAKGRELATGVANLTFREGDARALPFAADEFDLLIFHTSLCHVPGPEDALTEARRVLRPGGTLLVYDGDYATTTVALGDNDPLAACADWAMSNLVHDRWLVRRLPRLARAAGFHVERFDSHGFMQTDEADYMAGLVSRGADLLVAAGRIDTNLADGLKREARRRVESGAFFGFIAFASLIARKPT
jgi:ubiquinone/menaquinone biosynthesis C-methylase UbiE